MAIRVNLYGGPGAGKSTTAAWLFAALKRRYPALKVELVREYVKQWVYDGKVPTAWDQVYLFGKQHHYEMVPIQNGVKCIVSDSPMLLSCYYAEQGDPDRQWSTNLFNIAMEHEALHPGIHIVMVRGNKEYLYHGRFETREQALSRDADIVGYLDDCLAPLHVSLEYVDFDKPEKALELVEEQLLLAGAISFKRRGDAANGDPQPTT